MTFKVEYNIGEVNNSPSTIPIWLSNANEENRQKFVTDLAAVSRGKDSATSPDKRYKHLLKEAAPNRVSDIEQGGYPSRPLEFLRVLVYYRVGYYGDDAIFELFSEEGKVFATVNELTFYNTIAKHSHFMEHVSKDDENSPVYGLKPLLTNMRALLGAKIPYEDIPYNKVMVDDNGVPYSMAVKIRAPMFVFNHLVTHTAFSKEARSERVTKIDPSEYWIPHDFRERLESHIEELGKDRVNTIYAKFLDYNPHADNEYTVESTEKIRDILLTSISQSDAQKIFQDLAYKKEVYQRAVLELRYKDWVMVGDTVDPKAWEHLFIERNVIEGYDNWTQLETSAVVNAIRKAYQDHITKSEDEDDGRDSIENGILQAEYDPRLAKDMRGD